MNLIDYIEIALLIIILITLLIIIIRKQKNNSNEIYSSLSKDINLEISNQIIKILENNNKLNQQNQDILLKYQRELNEFINNKIHSLDIQLQENLKNIDNKVNTSVIDGFKNTNETYEKLIERLVSIDKAQENITNLSQEVVSLKNVLGNNQNRGKFGEFTLERILFSIFGDAKAGIYETQYQLCKDSLDRPDAVVFLPEPNHLICIDSKFPYQDYQKLISTESNIEKQLHLKNFSQALKVHIKDIKNKYIIKDKTASQAIMFIPSDSIFAFINGELYDIVEFAHQQNVIITSPSTLQPILATINLVKLSYERAKNINFISEEIKKLGKDFTKFAEDWERFSKNVRNLSSSCLTFEDRVRILNNRFNKIENNNIEELKTDD